MNAQQSTNVLDLVDDIQPLIDGKDIPGIVDAVTPASSQQLSLLLERLSVQDQAIVYRLLPKEDRKSTRLNSSHVATSYAVFSLKKKKEHTRLLRSSLPGLQTWPMW